MNRLVILVSSAVLIVGILVYIISKSQEDGGFFGEDTNNPSKSSMSKTSDPTKPSGTRENTEDPTADGVTPSQLLEQYEEWAQYPPYSRPLSSANFDLINPFFIESPPDIMLNKIGDKDPNGFVCHLQPKSWAVVGDESMIITLECRDKERNRAKINIESSQMFREFDGKRFGAVSPDVNDRGSDGDVQAGDNIYTFKWRPLKADWGQMLLTTKIAYGPENKKAELQTSFFSSPNRTAEFTGVFSDTKEDGSLVIRAAVQVYKKGNYHLEANLKDEKNGEWIGYSTVDETLASGRQEVTFVFFGKLLRDKNLDGPYVITLLRGHRVNLPIDPEWFNQGAEGLRKIQEARSTEPDRELVTPYKDEYKTRYYKVEDFSKAQWDSKEKRERIEQLKNLKN